MIQSLRIFILATLFSTTLVGPGVARSSAAGSTAYSMLSTEPALEAGYRAIVERALSKLPISFQAQLPRTLQFHLRDGTGRPAEMIDDKVFLRTNLLREYLRDSSQANFRRQIVFSRHPDFTTFMTALILHELSHMIDDRHRLSALNDFELLHFRHFYQEDKSTNSDSPMEIAPERKRGNYFEGRSVDPYEFKSPQEAFAVGFEFFVLDPEFKCRRPAHYEFYRERLGWSPSNATCADFVKHFYINPSLTAADIFEPQIVSPRGKLYAIHYLVAGAGKGIMSRFGHAMLRFVYCDPDRSEAGDQCLFDVDQHVVFTPAAAVMDLEISQIDGMTGKYKSSFFAAQIGATSQLYNRIEERDLFSIPLTLTPAQLAAVESAVHDSHWTYRNKYYFTFNNCATEILHVLKRALPTHQALQTSFVSTPFSLLDRMKQFGLAEDRGLEHWKADKTKRYYFPPATAVLQQLAKFAADRMERPEIVGYMKMTGAERKSAAGLARKAKDADRVTRALAALETNLLLKRHLEVFRAMVKDSSLRPDIKVANDNVNEVHQSWFAPPTVLSTESYGVPSNEEISEVLNNRKAAIESLNKDRVSMFSTVKKSSAQTAEQKLVLESEEILKQLEQEENAPHAEAQKSK